jgi:hypothetical protein
MALQNISLPLLLYCENFVRLKNKIRSNCAKEIKTTTTEQMAINAKELEAVSLKIHRKLYLLPLIAEITSVKVLSFY